VIEVEAVLKSYCHFEVLSAFSGFLWFARIFRKFALKESFNRKVKSDLEKFMFCQVHLKTVAKIVRILFKPENKTKSELDFKSSNIHSSYSV
jgi:hypothetical protein